MAKIKPQASRILRIAADAAAPIPAKNYVYRLLAFGALSSGTLFNDIVENGPADLLSAANAYRSNPHQLNVYGPPYLTALGFPADFANNVMPWAQMSANGMNAMQGIIEPEDDIEYGDGGCTHGLMAALAKV